MRKMGERNATAVVAVMLLLLSVLSVGETPTLRATAQGPDAELVFYMGASTQNPFSDISGKQHQVINHPNNSQDPVGLVDDDQLHRKVYSLSNGAFFEVPDSFSLLKLDESDVLTIEMNIKFHDYISCHPPLPQIVLSKGKITTAYPRNYQFRLYWQAFQGAGGCETGYIPGLAIGYSRFAGYFFGPYSDRPLLGWNVFTFRLYKTIDNNGNPGFHRESYINGEMISEYDLPGDNFAGNVYDEDGLLPPLNIGNGYQIGPEEPSWQANPFTGFIDYVRIYKGFLPIEEMNPDPYSPILPDLPVTNRPPVAKCRNLTIDAGTDCRATITAAMIDNGSFDPDNDAITLSIDNLGPFSAGPSGQQTYPVTLTVTDPDGLSASCPANVTILDVLPPTISLSDPVCVQEGKGKMANKLILSATDACSGSVETRIESIRIINNGGQTVNGKGIYSISGNTIFVYPNGIGWKIEILATASDAKGNPTGTIKLTKSLMKC